MNRPMLFAAFIGAAVGSPLGVMVLFLVAWRAAQKANATEPADRSYRLRHRRMIGSLRALAGDALIALGEKFRGEFENVDVWPGEYHVGGAMESDGFDLAKPIPIDEVRCALDELGDSQLLAIAAKVIEAWTPLLLPTTHALTDVHVLVAALRDRAAQFEAVELDAERPFLTAAHLTRSAQTRPE